MSLDLGRSLSKLEIKKIDVGKQVT